jgi:A/G-specific adenine glycosylase
MGESKFCCPIPHDMPAHTTPVNLSSAAIRSFRQKIYRYYRSHGRTLPWRKTRNPYHILVSEIMLQQTQVERVLQKYPQFVTAFPDFKTLAKAPLRKILHVWQGMGYNRRALFLKKIAVAAVEKFNGRLPRTIEELMSLSGIGKNTAASISAFAFNKPVAFIETNIRSVFIHCFFQDQYDVNDREILPLVEKTLDIKNPCEWYNALMDYGVMLKKNHPNPSRKSVHHQRQGKFEGSNRQVRGMIIKAITGNPLITESALMRMFNIPAQKIKDNLVQLQREGFIKRSGKKLSIA